MELVQSQQDSFSHQGDSLISCAFRSWCWASSSSADVTQAAAGPREMQTMLQTQLQAGGEQGSSKVRAHPLQPPWHTV